MNKVILKNSVPAKYFRPMANLSICLVVMALAMSMFFSSCEPEKDDPEPPTPTQEANFTAFSFTGIIGTATIDQNGKIITALAGSSVDLTTLKVNFTLSPNATAIVNGVPQTSGVSENNFSLPVTYVVTSGDGSTAKNWTVTIAKEGEVVTELTDEIINTGDKILAQGTYLIKNTIYLQGPNRLTISPGTVFKFANGRSFEINDNATLIASGTAVAPILFTSERSGPQPGDWGYLYVGKCDGSILEYCTFEYGGSSDYWGMVIVDCEMKINNCAFKNSKYMGFWARCDAGFKEFSNNTFVNCADHDGDEHPMYTDGINKLRNFGSGNTFSNTAPNKGIMVNGGTSERNMTLKKTNVPFYLRKIYVNSNNNTATLTLDPGVQIKFMQDAGIEIGNNGKLVAQGTATDRIKITGLVDQKGYWAYIYFDGNVLEGNVLEYCDVTNGGRNDYYAGAIVASGTRTDQLAIKNCHIAKSASYGIYFMYDGDAEMEGNTFADCTSGETNKP